MTNRMSFDELVKYIKEYDSDTFFAKGADLTDAEAHELAETCIDYFVKNGLDGVKLDCWLHDIRPCPEDEDADYIGEG